MDLNNHENILASLRIIMDLNNHENILPSLRIIMNLNNQGKYKFLL